MAMADNIKGKMGDMDKDMDSMRQRYNELRQKEQNNDLDDKGRQELSKIRSKLNM